MKILKKFKKHSSLNTQKARTIQQVAILGYADAAEDGKLYKSVFDVGKALGDAGYVVVDGGGPGVMRAATLGAKEAGGKVIAVTLYPKGMSHFEGKDPENLFDREIKTKNYVERTLTLMK